MNLSGADQYDTFILFSGDSDFLPLLRALKEQGKEVQGALTWGFASVIVSVLVMDFA